MSRDSIFADRRSEAFHRFNFHGRMHSCSLFIVQSLTSIFHFTGLNSWMLIICEDYENWTTWKFSTMILWWVTFVHTWHLHVCRWLLTQKQHKFTSLLILLCTCKHFPYTSSRQNLQVLSYSTYLFVSVLGGSPHQLVLKLLVFVNKLIHWRNCHGIDWLFLTMQQIAKFIVALSLSRTLTSTHNTV